MDRTVRRLAAILAADVVGYSGKIEADEGSTLAALKDVRVTTIDPLLAENSGRIVKTMGDGFIAEFGSVVDAVAFAVAMQKAVPERQQGTAPEKRLVYRIGINLGDVVVESDDLLGDGVNVAARLEQLCKPGGILISGTAYDQLQGKLGLALDFVGEQQVKNISRPVRTYVVRLAGSGPAWRHVFVRTFRRARPMIAAALAALMVVGGSWWYTHRAVSSAHPSIAVMPFDNLGGDAAAERLAHGVSADIVTDFSRFHDIDVVASASTEAYRDKSADIRQIARDLGVHYVLKGSIQSEGEQIRVNAQLFDGVSGANLWSNRWDRPAGDVFSLQSEIADRVLNALGGYNFFVKQSAAAARRKPPSDLQAYDLWALAAAAFEKGTQEGFADALKYADAAIAKDPQLTRAYVKKAWAILNLVGIAGDIPESSRAEMMGLARKALEVDPYDAEAHILLATLLSINADNKQAMVESDKALELNPSSADILMKAAGNMSYFGKPGEGAAMCDRGFRLNPAPPPWYPTQCPENYYFTKRYQDSVDISKRIAAWTSPRATQLAWLAAAQVELGASGDAATTVADLKSRFPDFVAEPLFGGFWAMERQQEEDQLVASLQKAGAPVCVPSARLGEFPKLKRLKVCDEERAKEATR